MLLKRKIAQFMRPKNAINWKKRIAITSSDKSCQDLPKVVNAGEVERWNGAPVQIMHNGLRVYAGCYYGDNMIKIIKNLKGHHEPQEEKIFYEILNHIPDEAVMIEVGSFWAYYSLWFSHEKPLRKNFLIEPVGWKARIGQLNFELNGKNIEVDRYYIQDPDLDIIKTASVCDDASINAKPIKIDDYIAMKELAHVDILHADIQGAELELLRGAEKSLKNKIIDVLFVATHGDKHYKCREFLTNINYQIIAEHDIAQASAADGLLVAVSENATIDLKTLK